MNTPTQAPWWERVPPDVVEAYILCARETRELQRHYRKTLSPRAKNDLPGLEDRFDRLTDQLAELLAVDQLAKPSTALVEGGAA